MDKELIQLLLGGLLGSGGLAGVVSALKAFKKTKEGVPTEEAEARRSADWESLNTYFQSELKSLREDRHTEIAQLRKDRATEVRELKEKMTRLEQEQTILRDHMAARAEEDAAFIDELEQHIWLRYPPPPPVRRRPGVPPPNNTPKEC